MLLASLARAIVSHPDLVAERKARAEARRLQQEQRERFRAEQLESTRVALAATEARMVAFHAWIDGLGLAPGLAETFKTLSGNEQRVFAEAAGEALCAAIPVYLAIAPEKRRDGLTYARRGPFLERLSDYLRQSRRTLADDDADLI